MIEFDPAVLGCDAKTAAAIKAMVATWPPLTETQKDRLAALLAPPPTPPADYDPENPR